MEKNLNQVEISIKEKKKGAIGDVHSGAGSWKTPFFILVALIIAMCAFFYRLFRKATKDAYHLR